MKRTCNLLPLQVWANILELECLFMLDDENLSSSCFLEPINMLTYEKNRFISKLFEITTWVSVIPCTFILLSNIYRDEDWHDNDGALNTVSMLYPRVPTAHPNCHLGPDFKDGQSLQTGIW